MEKKKFSNYEIIINDDQTKELVFESYKILEYKHNSKSIEKYGANFYLINSMNDYKNRRISAVYTKGHDLKEFYFDTVRDHYKGTIENKKLIIDEIPRDEYLEVVKELKALIK